MSLFHVGAVNVHTALRRIMPTEMSACMQKYILICPQLQCCQRLQRGKIKQVLLIVDYFLTIVLDVKGWIVITLSDVYR